MPITSEKGLIKNAGYYTLDKRFFDILAGKFETSGMSDHILDYANERTRDFEEDDIDDYEYEEGED